MSRFNDNYNRFFCPSCNSFPRKATFDNNFYTERFRIAVHNAVANDVIWKQHFQDCVNEYIDNAQKMQQLLTTHIEQLESTTRDKIQEIVNEDQYHVVNKAFFEAVEQKVQGQISSQFGTQISILKWISGLSVLSVLGIGGFVMRR